MKNFFKNLLESLERKTGLKQYERLLATENPAESIRLLLDELCKEAARFDLKEEVKTNLIEKGIFHEKFIGLNAKFVYNTLANYAATLNQLPEDFDKGEDYRGKPLDPKTKELIEKTIQGWTSPTTTTNNSGTKLKEMLMPETTTKSTGYKGPDKEYLYWRERIREIARRHYSSEQRTDGQFGFYFVPENRKPGEPSFEVFAKSQSDANQIYQEAIKI